MSIDQRKRAILKAASALYAWLGMRQVVQGGDDMTMDIKRRKKWDKEMRTAEDQDALEVELLYSTKLIHFRMAGHEYQVPANYFTPKWEDDGTGNDVSNGFGFFLFLPNYEGYTKTNWRDPFDARLIQVLQVSPVDKEATTTYTDGTRGKTPPESYGEPDARFRNIRRSLEDKPTYNLYGLEGFRRRNSREDSVIWTGKRSNGEFFYFKSSFSPNTAQERQGLPNPLCETQYYSAQEDLFIAYHYSQAHLEKWREIDDAIWKKIYEWRVK